MNRLFCFLFFFFVSNIANISNAKDFSVYKSEIYNFSDQPSLQEKAPADISATITGPASVCLKSTNENITFTGAGGKPPYTFIYHIDGGSQNSIKTTGSNSSLTIPITTTALNTYIFNLDSVFDASGKQAQTGSVTVTVKALPVFDFTFIDNQCTGAGVQFTPSLTGSTYTYAWDFGDGKTSTQEKPTHFYNAFGAGTQTFAVKLTITDNSTTCQNTTTKNIVIKQIPDASLDFNGNNGATLFDPTQQIFINCGATTSSPQYDFIAVNASTTSLTNSGYIINWGDGSTDNLPNSFTSIKHQYLLLGYFNIKITANYALTGCTTTKTYKFFNGNTPGGNLLSIPNTQDCVPYTLVWPVQGVKDNTPGTTYNFSVNDGSPDLTYTQLNLPDSISHTFTRSSCGLPGSQFIVTFTVTNPCNSTSPTLQVQATQKPIASFNISTGLNACLNNSVKLTNTSIGNYLIGSTCSTNFNKTWSIFPTTGWTGSLSNSDIVNVNFNIPGDYNVKLKIIRPNSPESRCTVDSITQTIHVNPLPTATISGGATVCKNSASPLITFTGANGTAPYTFTYTVNGTQKSVSTTSGNSVTVPVSTDNAGTFTYSLVSVQESSTSACSQAQTGTAFVTVNPLPTATISGNTSVCINSASPLITFTGATGIAPYTFTYNINGEASQSITTITGKSISIQVPTDATGTFKYNLTNVQDAGTTACSQTQTGTATIIVNPTPAAMILPDYEYCNGVRTSVISFNNTVTGTTYSWTNSNISIGLAASGTGNIPLFTAKNNTASAVTSIITVTPTANGCPGASQTFKITVNPSAAVTFSATDQTVCSGENTAQAILNSSTTGAAFSWTAIQPAGITGVTTSGTDTIPVQTLINTTNAPIPVIYRAKATLSGVTTCAGAEYDYTIIVNPKPVITTVLSNAICSGSTFNFTPVSGNGNVIPTGTKYTWIAPVINPAGTVTGGSMQNTALSGISQTLENVSPSIATATYTVTPVVNGCSGSTFDVVVTVYPKPTVIKPNNITFCNKDTGADIVFTGNAPGTVYTWESNNTSIGINSSGTDKIPAFIATNTGTLPVTSMITVTPTYSNKALSCIGETEQFSITVNPTAQVNRPDSLVACSGQNALVNFNTKNSGGLTTYAWTNNNTAINLASGGSGNLLFSAVNATTAPLKAVVTVTPTYSNGGMSCAGLPETFKIIVNPKGKVTNPGNQSVCKDQNISINFATVNTGDTTSYSWTNSNKNIGLAVSGTGNLSFVARNTGTAPITASITVTPTFGKGNLTCPGAAEQFDFTVNPSAAVLFSQPKQTVCTGDITTLVTLSSTSAGVTFNWTAEQPAGITGVITSGTNTIPPQTLINATNKPIAVIFKAKASIAGVQTCAGQEYNDTIIVDPKPVISNNQQSTICNGDTYTFSPAEGSGNIVPTGTKYTWTTPVISPAASALTGGSAQGTPQLTFTQSLTNATPALASATYTVTPTANGCTGTPFEIVVSVIPTPTVTTIANTTLCNGAKYSEFVFAGNVSGTVYKWSSNNNANIGVAGSGLNKIPEFTATITGNSPITDTITVTPTYGNNGVSCEGKAEHFTITVNPTGQVNNPGNSEACNGVTNNVNFTTKNTGGNTTYSWTNSTPGIGIGATGTGNISFTPQNPGITDLSAIITVTPTITNDGVSCDGIPEQFNLVVHPTPTVDQPTNQTVCNGFQTVAIHFTGEIPATTYNWSIDNSAIGLPATGTGDISAFTAINNSSNAITATIAVTPLLNGCYGNPENFTITVNPSPIFTTQPQSITICKDEKLSELSVSYKNSIEVPTYQWYSNTINSTVGSVLIPNANTASYSPTSSNTGTMFYYCELAFPTGGCSTLLSNIAAITINPYPVISDYTILIGSGQTFDIDPGSLTGNIVPVGTTYTWPAPVISPVNSITGTSSQSTPQTIISQTLTDTTHRAGTATYIVTPVSGMCKGTDFNIVVTVNPSIAPDITLKNIDCFGANNGSIQITIEGGIPFPTGDPYHVSWTGPTGFTSKATSINGLSPGVYNLTISDSGGLPFSMNYTISEPAVINLKTVTTKNVSCFDAANGEISLSVTGGTPPYKYTWTKNATPFTGSEDIQNLNPGNYSVIVTDANNCNPQTASFSITEPAEIVITLIRQINLICFGDTTGAISVNVAGGVPIEDLPGVLGYTYLWIGPNGFTSVEKDLINIATGIYTLTVTDHTGCTRNFTTTVTQPDEVKINATTTPVTCYGANNATIKLNITGGIPPYQISWSNLGKSTYQDNLSPGTYTITVTDNNGCLKSEDIIVTEAGFSIQPEVKNVTCFGARNGSINLNVHGGIPPVSLVWSDNPTAGYIRNNLNPGNYTATLSDASCSFTRNFTVTGPLELKLSAEITHAFDCKNPNGGAIRLTISGGTQPYTILWSNGETTKDLSGIPAGTYIVNITDLNGCTVSKQYEVMRRDPLALSVDTVPDFNCQTNVLKEVCTAKVTGGIPPYQFTWSSGTVSGFNGPDTEITQSGIVILDVTDGAGCTATYTFNLSIPAPGINYNIINCDAHIFDFKPVIPYGIESDYSFFWDFGDGTSQMLQTPEHTYSNPGTYRVRLTMKNATCTAVFEKIITVEASPVLVLDKLPVFCTGDSILLHVTGADSYRWYNGVTGDSLFIKQAGDYSVSGTSKAGCTSTLNFKATNFDSYNYTVQSDRNEITTKDPTIELWSESITYSDYFWDFGDNKSATGNNQTHSYDILKDGYFDVKLKIKNPKGCYEFATKRIWITDVSAVNIFTPNGDGIDDVFLKGWHAQIYNRNGILLYEGVEGWNGTYKGKPVSNGTYFYVVYIPGPSGTKTKTSFVTVVR